MTDFISTIITTLTGSVLGLGIWLINLGNRTSLLEQKHQDFTTLLNFRFDEIARRLERIEKGMNGALKGNDHAH